MKNPYKVPVHAIVTPDEKGPPDTTLDELQSSITSVGLKVPILIDQTNHQLIDGVRRLQVFKRLKISHILVHGAEDFEEALQFIKASREKPRLPAPQHVGNTRLWRYNLDLENLMTLRQQQLKSRRIGVPKKVSLGRAPAARALLTEAIGIPEGMLVAITTIHKAAEHHEDLDIRAFARGLVGNLNAERMTPHQARHALGLEVARKKQGHIVTIAGQRDAFRTLATQLSGVARGVAQLGEVNEELTPEEIAEYVDSLSRSMTVIRSHSLALKKRIKET